MTAAAITPHTDVEALGRDVTAFMMGSPEPIAAFEQALKALGIPGDAGAMTTALRKEVGWMQLVSRIHGGVSVSLLKIVTNVLRRYC